jgi:predicted RNase H-like HicB family nuclease
MEYKYRMNVWWSEEDQAFLVEVPELPGAMADGATPEEAIANVRETIRLWIAFAREHGREVPEPEALAARGAS